MAARDPPNHRQRREPDPNSLQLSNVEFPDTRTGSDNLVYLNVPSDWQGPVRLGSLVRVTQAGQKLVAGIHYNPNALHKDPAPGPFGWGVLNQDTQPFAGPVYARTQGAAALHLSPDPALGPGQEVLHEERLYIQLDYVKPYYVFRAGKTFSQAAQRELEAAAAAARAGVVAAPGAPAQLAASTVAELAQWMLRRPFFSGTNWPATPLVATEVGGVLLTKQRLVVCGNGGGNAAGSLVDAAAARLLNDTDVAAGDKIEAQAFLDVWESIQATEANAFLGRVKAPLQQRQRGGHVFLLGTLARP